MKKTSSTSDSGGPKPPLQENNTQTEAEITEAIEAALDKKAQDIVWLDLSGVCSFTDNFIVCIATWLLPTVVVAAAACAYVAVRRDTWEATQTLVIRNEATNNHEGPGRFRQIDDMKITQETLLEIAKSRSVLAAALAEVGPSAGPPNAAWPTDEDIAELRYFLSLTPPKGAEFGKTEIFYLKVKAREKSRAASLAGAVCRHLQSGLKQLRQAKAQSMIDELSGSVELARANLRASTAKLAAMEQQVGGDLGELRMLDLTATGDSDLRRKLSTIENELRETQNARQLNRELFNLLQAADGDAGRLLATPNRLLESQPALRKLKDGLVEAQLRTAQLLGNMREGHPQVAAARAAEQGIGDDLHRELNIAIRGVELELKLSSQRLASLEEQQQGLRQRLDRLAGLRAEYSTLSADMKHRTALAERAQQDLSEAHASLAGAHGAGVLSAVDRPESGARPVGPSGAVIVAAGAGGGLLIGLGLLFLTATPIAAVETIEPVDEPAEELQESLGNHVLPRLVGFADRGLSLNDALRRVARRSRAGGL